MSAVRRRLTAHLASAALAGALGISAAAAEPHPLTEGGAPDAGLALSSEDSEVVDNLELLENLDAAGDLELLLELSRDEER